MADRFSDEPNVRADVRRDHKRRVPETDPDGIYSGMLNRLAIEDGTAFPEMDRPPKKVLGKGQKSKGR